MMQRIRAVAVVAVMVAGALALAPPATAKADPAIHRVQVSPRLVVVGKSAVKVTFTVFTTGAGDAELRLDAPGPGAPVPLTLTPAPHGNQTRWTATRTFGDHSRAGLWRYRVIAHAEKGKKGAETSTKGSFRVVKARDSRIVGFDARPEPVKKGEWLTVSGRLLVQDRNNPRDWDGLRGERILIQFKSHPRATWETVDRDRTGAGGWFRERVKAGKSGWYRALYTGRQGILGDGSSFDFVKVVEPRAETRIVGFDAYREPVKRGRDLRFKGRLLVADGGGWDGLRAPVKLLFKADGRDEYRPVKTVWTAKNGWFFTTGKAWRSGSWKVAYAGGDDTKPSESVRDHVRVRW